MAGLIDALFPQPTPGGAPGTVDPRQAMWNQFASNMGAIVGRRPNSVQPLYGAYQKQQELNNLTRARELNNQIRQQQLEEAKQRRERETERLADLSSVMGGPPVAMGPPTASGEMNVEPGTAPTMSPDEYFMRHHPEQYLKTQMQDQSTNSFKKYRELVQLGMDPTQAQQVAYGQQQGPSLVVGPDGRIAFNATGQAQLPPLPMGTTATNQVQKGVLDKTNTLAQLNSIQDQFKPEYQQLGNRIGHTWSNVKDWMGVAAPEEQAQLVDWHQFRTGAQRNLMAVMHSLGGSALTEQEIERISQTIPDVGVNFWEGDGPTQFQAKMAAAQKDLRRALLRADIAQREGIGFGTIPLTDAAIGQKLDEIGGRIEAAYIQQGMSKAEAVERTKADLRRQFQGLL